MPLLFHDFADGHGLAFSFGVCPEDLAQRRPGGLHLVLVPDPRKHQRRNGHYHVQWEDARPGSKPGNLPLALAAAQAAEVDPRLLPVCRTPPLALR